MAIHSTYRVSLSRKRRQSVTSKTELFVHLFSDLCNGHNWTLSVWCHHTLCLRTALAQTGRVRPTSATCWSYDLGQVTPVSHLWGRSLRTQRAAQQSVRWVACSRMPAVVTRVTTIIVAVITVIISKARCNSTSRLTYDVRSLYSAFNSSPLLTGKLALHWQIPKTTPQGWE